MTQQIDELHFKIENKTVKFYSFLAIKYEINESCSKTAFQYYTVSIRNFQQPSVHSIKIKSTKSTKKNKKNKKNKTRLLENNFKN